MNTEFGILYSATGGQYVQEAIDSAASVKKCMPDIGTAIVSHPGAQIPDGIFDATLVNESPAFAYSDKILPLIQTPFNKTLFLDTDTYMIEPVYELAALLDRFDVACCHAPVRSVYPVDECSAAFPEINTGVILYKNCQPVLALLRAWSEIYLQQMQLPHKPMHDQPAFRKAVYESSVQLCILPPEYNLRTIFPFFAGGGAKVKILHGRGPSLEHAILWINCELATRVGDLTSKRKRLAHHAKRLISRMRKSFSSRRH